MPLWPWRAQSNGDFINGPTDPVKNPVFLSKPGSSFPSLLVSSGLWSHVSTWLGPPFMKSQITDLARAGK